MTSVIVAVAIIAGATRPQLIGGSAALAVGAILFVVNRQFGRRVAGESAAI